MRTGLVAGRVFGAILAFVLAVAPAAADWPVFGWSRIVVFGDFYSDTGNTYAILHRPTRPYLPGRYTNGPAWVEYLSVLPMKTQAEANGGPIDNLHSTNAAVGGDILLGKDGANNLDAEIKTYFERGGLVRGGDRVVVFVGAEDAYVFFAIATSGVTWEQYRAAYDAFMAQADAEAASLAKLIAHGARHIVVGAIPPVDHSPKIGQDLGTTAFAIPTYNRRLGDAIATLRRKHPGVEIEYVNFYNLFSSILSAPEAWGFADTTQACIKVPACAAGGKAIRDRYLWWDARSPTARVHALMAYTAGIALSP